MTDLKTKDSIVDYAASLDCIHCGLCLNTCPTYRLTGSEASSPRGRIHLMRAVAEERVEPDEGYREEMEFCLVCRHCESVCPAGVRFGSMMEFARSKLPRSFRARVLRALGFRLVLPNRWALRGLTFVLRVLQAVGLTRFLPGGDQLPELRKRPRFSPPPRTPAAGVAERTVAVHEGCVMPELFGPVQRATVNTLAATGHDVLCSREPVCCGSLHAHNGEVDTARRLAMRTIDAHEALEREHGSDLHFVTNSAGCGSHMREYAHLFEDEAWRARAAAFAAKVRDLSEVLAPHVRRTGSDSPTGSVTWDAPCHLCHGQGVRAEPLAILQELGGEAYRELTDAESCCGSAGIYSLLRPTDSEAVLAPKLEALRASGAKTLVTANPGCHLQWEAGIRKAGLDVEVIHLAEFVDRSMRS